MSNSRPDYYMDGENGIRERLMKPVKKKVWLYNVDIYFKYPEAISTLPKSCMQGYGSLEVI